MTPRGDAGRGRGRLSEDSIVADALELVDSQGVKALTMRALAQRLDVQPMAFYHHFPNKEALLDRVVDDVIGSIELPPFDLDWETWTREFLRRAKDALLRHPNRVELVLDRPGSGIAYANMFGAFVGVLVKEDVNAAVIHTAWHLLISYLLGYLQQFHAPVQTMGRGPIPPGGPSDNLALIATEVEACTDAHEFEAGLEMILGAIKSHIEPKESARR